MLTGGTPIGASSAAGLLSLADIKAYYTGLAIEFDEVEQPEPVPVYRQVLNEDFDRLPDVTRRLHRGRPAIVAIGEAIVEPATSVAARLVARIFGMPTTGGRQSVRVVIENRNGQEHWTRTFDGKPMRSTMRAQGEFIQEKFGLLVTSMRLAATADGLDMKLVGCSFLGMLLPRFMRPRIKAEERVDPFGRHLFEVEITVPILGRIVSYRGHLDF